MNFSSEAILSYLTATAILAAIVAATYVIGKLIQYFVSYISGKTGFSDWMMKFHIGRAILRSGLTVGDFFGKVSMWVIFLLGLLLGLGAWFQMVGYADIGRMFVDAANTYVLGFVKALVVIIVGFVLTDAFIGYVYKGGEGSAQTQFLVPVAEYLRLVFYLATLLFALEVGGISVKTLAAMLTPIVWGLTAIMIIIAVARVVGEIASRPREK